MLDDTPKEQNVTDMDTTIDGLVDEMWAIALDRQDVATRMTTVLWSFAADIRADERTACAAVCDDVGMEFYWAHNLPAETAAHECYGLILARNTASAEAPAATMLAEEVVSPTRIREEVEAAAYSLGMRYIPEGWVLVPIEPTTEMDIEGAGPILFPAQSEYPSDRARRVWAAMIEVAPKEPK